MLSNLVVDYVSFRLRSRQSNNLGIRAYMSSLRTPRTVLVVGQLLEHIHAHCLSKHGVVGGGHVIDATKFMHAYLFADRVPATEQDLAIARTRAAARPLLSTFSTIVARLRWLGSSATMDGVDADLTAPFLPQLSTFYNALDGYEGVDRNMIVTRIEHALVGLYQLRSTYVEGGNVPFWLAECDTQINMLRARFIHIDGMEALDRFHAGLDAGVRVPA